MKLFLSNAKNKYGSGNEICNVFSMQYSNLQKEQNISQNRMHPMLWFHKN